MVQLMRVAVCKFWDFQKHSIMTSRVFDDCVYDHGDDKVYFMDMILALLSNTSVYDV